VAGGATRWENALLSEAAILNAAAQPGPQLYLLHPDDAANLALLRTLRPEGQTYRHVGADGRRPFLVYLVPGPPD
jgi:hypothetical protein